ncbi:MAG: bifunctional DNA primase/polymerase, partial [Chloroflexi bacterium]|nr:bifunctional DNA primase/polymerase [Chloroflexota bacterium]
MSETPLVSAALMYASELGWAVFPVHSFADGCCTCGKSACASAGKHPRTRNGFKDATDPQTIEAWWSKWPHANIGIRTGAESGLVVIDLDPRHGSVESVKALEKANAEFPG